MLQFRHFYTVSPVKLQRYRIFQRSKFKFMASKDQHFVVHLHVGIFSNVRLGCNSMGLTLFVGLVARYLSYVTELHS